VAFEIWEGPHGTIYRDPKNRCLGEKAQLVQNVWKVKLRPTSSSRGEQFNASILKRQRRPDQREPGPGDVKALDNRWRRPMNTGTEGFRELDYGASFSILGARRLTDVNKRNRGGSKERKRGNQNQRSAGRAKRTKKSPKRKATPKSCLEANKSKKSRYRAHTVSKLQKRLKESLLGNIHWALGG